MGAGAPTTLGSNGFLTGSMPWPRVDRAKGVNGVTTEIRSRNHIYSALVEGLIFTKTCIRGLGMGMERC